MMLRLAIHRSQALQTLTCSRLTGSRCLLSTSLYYQQQLSTIEQAKSFKSIPGPKPLPLIGNLLDISRALKSGKKLFEYYDEGLKKYGGSGDVVVVADPESIEDVLRAEGRNPERGQSFGPNITWFAKECGIPATLTEDGEAWRRQRTAMNKQVLPKVVNSYIDDFNSIYRRFSGHLRKIRDENGLIENYVPLSKKLTMEVTGKFVFEADLDLLANPKEDLDFLDKVDQFFEALGQLSYELPLFKLYKNEFYKFYCNALLGTNAHSSKYATNLEEKLARGEKTPQCMLEEWLTEKKLTKPEALGASATLLSAGVHTVQEILYNEIQSVVGDGPPTAEHLETLPYLRACIKETLRVRPVVSGYVRVLKEDIVVHGYHVPAGVGLLYWAYTCNKDEKIFENPSQFKPERWLKKDGSHKHHPFALLPFGFGPRQCYGKRFAELEMKLLTIEMIRQFSLRTDKEYLEFIERLVNVVDEGVSLYLTDRI